MTVSASPDSSSCGTWPKAYVASAVDVNVRVGPNQAVLTVGLAIGGGGPEELTSQFRLSQRWHVSARFLLTPYH